MEQSHLFGWFSLKEYEHKKVAYLYNDKNNINVICTFTSDNNICPYYQRINSFSEDVIFIGELKEYIKTIEYNTDILYSFIYPKISDHNKKDRLKYLSFDKKKFE